MDVFYLSTSIYIYFGPKLIYEHEAVVRISQHVLLMFKFAISNRIISNSFTFIKLSIVDPFCLIIKSKKWDYNLLEYTRIKDVKTKE